jgi:hypothetical protein
MFVRRACKLGRSICGARNSFRLDRIACLDEITSLRGVRRTFLRRSLVHSTSDSGGFTDGAVAVAVALLFMQPESLRGPPSARGDVWRAVGRTADAASSCRYRARPVRGAIPCAGALRPVWRRSDLHHGCLRTCCHCNTATAGPPFGAAAAPRLVLRIGVCSLDLFLIRSPGLCDACSVCSEEFRMAPFDTVHFVATECFDLLFSESNVVVLGQVLRFALLRIKCCAWFEIFLSRRWTGLCTVVSFHS